MWRAIHRNLVRPFAISQSCHQCKPVLLLRHYSPLTRMSNIVLLRSSLSQSIRFLAYSSSSLTSTAGNDDQFVEPTGDEAYDLQTIEAQLFERGEQQLLEITAVHRSYGDEKNSLASELSACEKASQVLGLCSSSQNELLPRHCVEILSTLSSIESTENLTTDHIASLLARIEELHGQMTGSEMIFCLVYLGQMGLCLNNNIRERMLRRIRAMAQSGMCQVVGGVDANVHLYLAY